MPTIKPAQTPMAHSTAAVSLDTLFLGLLAMVSSLVCLYACVYMSLSV